MAMLRQYGLRMELHAIDRPGAVRQRHDDAVSSAGLGAKRLRKRVQDSQRVVPADGDRAGDVLKQARSRVFDERSPAMNRLDSPQPTPEGRGHRLVPQADPQEWQVARQSRQERQAHARLGRRARPGAEYHGLESPRGDLSRRNRVIADDNCLVPQLPTVPGEVVDEAVVVIDNEDHEGIVGRWRAARKKQRAAAVGQAGLNISPLTLTLRDPGQCAPAAGREGKGETAMAYTVKQVAAISGVSVRTLHFYDETGLLKPASYGTNGYRLYEEPQLLTLQQILFFRELGFELKRIKEVLGRPEFETVAALESHRAVLHENLARAHKLIETVNNTIEHLKGTRSMKTEDMFEGFSVAAGEDRFGEHVELGGEPIDCKLSGRDTDGAMCVFEFRGSGGGPSHRHQNQDEWIYILDGEYLFQVGDQQFRAAPGQCVFIPRGVSHSWGVTNGVPGRVINTYQPAGKIEAFFREVGRYDRDGKPQIHEALSLDEMRSLFQDHDIDLVGPPVVGNWEVEDGRIRQRA